MNEETSEQRNAQINIRVSQKEKELIRQKAKEHGFRSISAFVMWIVNNVSKKNQNVS